MPQSLLVSFSPLVLGASLPRAPYQQNGEVRSTGERIPEKRASPESLLVLLQDLAPYLPSVTPGLKASLLDPVPEVSLEGRRQELLVLAQSPENLSLRILCVSAEKRRIRDPSLLLPAPSFEPSAPPCPCCWLLDRCGPCLQRLLGPW